MMRLFTTIIAHNKAELEAIAKRHAEKLVADLHRLGAPPDLILYEVARLEQVMQADISRSIAEQPRFARGGEMMIVGTMLRHCPDSGSVMGVPPACRAAPLFLCDRRSHRRQRR